MIFYQKNTIAPQLVCIRTSNQKYILRVVYCITIYERPNWPIATCTCTRITRASKQSGMNGLSYQNFIKNIFNFKCRTTQYLQYTWQQATWTSNLVICISTTGDRITVHVLSGKGFLSLVHQSCGAFEQRRIDNYTCTHQQCKKTRTRFITTRGYYYKPIDYIKKVRIQFVCLSRTATFLPCLTWGWGLMIQNYSRDECSQLELHETQFQFIKMLN